MTAYAEERACNSVTLSRDFEITQRKLSRLASDIYASDAISAFSPRSWTRRQ